jgi:glutamyl-tRNA synthetase
VSIDTSKLDNTVRVRFPPSPTGDPHVGLVRSALFNYAFARHYGGTLVFRIEDTDAARNTEESYLMLLDTLRWAGIEWDEGPEVGGEYGPYRQSRAHRDLRGDGRAAAEGGPRVPLLLHGRGARGRARAGHRREAGARLRGHLPQPDRRADRRAPRPRAAPTCCASGCRTNRTITWDDLVRGEISFESANVPDYVLVRADGSPLYTLVNPVDDALMGITHVLRGEDLLSSTPRQIPLHEALVEIGVVQARSRRSATCRT